MALVKINLGRLKRLGTKTKASSSHMTAFYKKAAARYLAFARRRFDKLSKGGESEGDKWAELAASTKKARRGARKGFKGARRFSILTDTGILKRALLQGSPGNLIQRTTRGIKVGIGGGNKHQGSDLTIGRLAQIHNDGEGHNPERKILTDQLDENTRRGLSTDLAVTMTRIIRETR